MTMPPDFPHAGLPPKPAAKPFPIPVAVVGPGSQGEEAPDYLPMPQSMGTFAVPTPETALSPELNDALVATLQQLAIDVQQTAFDPACPTLLDLMPLPPPLRVAIGQSLGFGEVSAYTQTPNDWQVQETAFPGLWRVIGRDGQGQVWADSLQCGPIPAILKEVMRQTSQPSLPPPAAYGPGTMNAPAVVEEISHQAARWQAGQAAHVINFTLLPVTPADLDVLYGWLSHHAVSILSRGYGNCRITSTRLQNAWWVQYFNTMDALILNTLEITDLPQAALAAIEDLQDTAERLAEYVDSMQGSATEAV